MDAATALHAGLADHVLPDPDVLGAAPPADVGQVPRGHRPEHHVQVVVDHEPLHLARQVERHRLPDAGPEGEQAP